MKLAGVFVFNDDGDGCLTGKWLNNGEPTAYPEAVKFQAHIDNETGQFCGSYLTTWIEQSNVSVTATLQITRPAPPLYTLQWLGPNNKVIFNGTAMLYKGMLIGYYWK